MTTFLTFCRKELLESVRTYRLWIMLAAFLVLGLMNPLTAKLLPALLNGADIGGVTIQMPDPTALDSWTQFFKNVSQLGGLALIIVFAGLAGTDLSRETLVIILAKGANRPAIIMAKLGVAALIWTASYGLCLGTTWAYNEYYWGAQNLPNAWLAFGAPWLFGLLMLACIGLGGVLAKNLYGGLIAPIGVYIGLSIVNLAPSTARYNPASLAGSTLGLLNGQSIPNEFTPAALICATGVIVLVAASVLVFNKRSL